MPKQRKTTAQFLSVARANANLVPSLSKYRRRRRLSPQEKAAITRAANTIARFGGREQLTPITRQQFRKLKPALRKTVVPRHGVRAVRTANIDDRGKSIGVRVVKGDLETTVAGRRWRIVPVPPDIDKIAASAKRIFASAKRRRKQISIAIQTTRGRSVESLTSFASVVNNMLPFLTRYMTEADFEDWFVGLTFFEET